MDSCQRLEGSYINKSLLTLSTVIHKLSEGTAGHIPFRDSKLTKLLQGSLSGGLLVAEPDVDGGEEAEDEG